MIADQSGSGGTGTNNFFSGGPVCTPGAGCGTYSGAGSWGLAKTGNGTLVLNGNNTFTGGVFLTDGTLSVGHNNALGSGTLTALSATLDIQNGIAIANAIDLQNNLDINVGAGATGTHAGAISQTGGSFGINKVGDGTLILSGTNTYSGATNVNAGTLRAGTTNTFSPSSAFNVAATATLDLNGFNQVISSLAGGGNVNLGAATLTAGGDNSSTTFSGVIGGSGGLTKIGTGTLLLTGNSAFTGGVTLNGGTLSVGHNSALGTGTLTALGSTLDIRNGITVANDIDLRNSLDVNVGTGATGTHARTIFQTGGSFGINKVGDGTLILSGAGVYSGATNVNAGTLRAGAVNAFSPFSDLNVAGGAMLDLNNFHQTVGSLAGAGNVLLGAANLTVGGNNNSPAAFSGVIGGSGGLTKIGAGVLNLTGNNTYTGATTVDGGGLLVNGSLASPEIVVNANAFVGGTGTLPSTTVKGGGALSPGNSIGILTVNGNLVLAAGSAYVVEVSPTDADRTNVAGTATIGGTVQAVAVPGSFRQRTYTILDAAGGLRGRFESLVVTGTFGNWLLGTLSYDANSVFLGLAPASISPLLPHATPLNPQTTAIALDAAVKADTIPPLEFDTLLNFSGHGLVAALSQLHGEVATGMQQAGLKALDMFLGTMLNPFLHGRGETLGGGPALAFAPEASSLPQDAQAAYAVAMPVKAPVAPASFGQRWSVWGSAYGGTSSTDGDAATGSQDTRTNAYGFAAGVDHRLTPDTLIGFALAGGGTSWSLAGGLGSGRSDMFQAGVYGSHRFGAAYISAAAAYTWHDASTNRNLTLAGVGQLDADFHAHSFGARLEGGYRWLTPFAGITPYGALQVLSIRTPGYAETGSLGAAPFALAYSSQTTTATRTELGLWLDRSMLLNPDAALTLRARAAWAHDVNEDRDIQAAFQTVPLAAFTVLGASPAQDYALLSGAAELRLRNGWSFALKGDAEVASRTQTFSGNGTLRYAW